MYKILAVFFILFAFPSWAANITSPGTYGAGTYTLQNDISVSSGDGLVFTGTATLDLNGHSVISTETGNGVGFGVKFQGNNSTISNGSISGFWAGVRFEGDNSSSTGVDYSARYIGVMVEADDVTITGGVISDIGGVTNSKYAIGVNSNGDGTVVSGVTFTNIYAQDVSGVGEGLAVNFSANSSNGTLLNGSFSNDNLEQDTIGVFASGEHTITGFSMHNIFRPVHSSGAPSNVSDVTVTYSMSPGNPGEVFSAVLSEIFGNMAGKTIKIRIKASELTQVTGTQTRLTLHAGSIEPFEIDSIYIGHATSGASASSLTQLKFGGSAGTVIPTGESVVTDWSSFVWDGTSDIIVSIHAGSDASQDMMPAKSGTIHTTYLKNASEASQASVTGYYAYPGYLSAVGKIEVQ